MNDNDRLDFINLANYFGFIPPDATQEEQTAVYYTPKKEEYLYTLADRAERLLARENENTNLSQLTRDYSLLGKEIMYELSTFAKQYNHLDIIHFVLYIFVGMMTQRACKLRNLNSKKLNLELDIATTLERHKYIDKFNRNPTQEDLKRIYKMVGRDDDENREDIKYLLTNTNSRGFDDIIGQDNLKQDLLSITIKSNLDSGVSPSILLYGPPGTGKTFIIAAFATEARRNFYNLPPSSLNSPIVGQAERLLKTVFQEARKEPSIIFIDEIETLFATRESNNLPPHLKSLLSQLLQELSGVNTNNENIIFVAATNYPEHLDSALNSRFLKKIYMGIPTSKDKEIMLEKMLERKPLVYNINKSQFENLVNNKLKRFNNRSMQSAINALSELKKKDTLYSTNYYMFRVTRPCFNNENNDMGIYLTPIPLKYNKEHVVYISNIDEMERVFDNREEALEKNIIYTLDPNLKQSKYIGYLPVSVDDFTDEFISHIDQISESELKRWLAYEKDHKLK